MTEKVILPSDVAEAIEKHRNDGCSNYEILQQASGAVFTHSLLVIKRWAFDRDGEGSPDKLMSALASGYKIEQSPEEKLRALYLNAKKELSRSVHGSGNCIVYQERMQTILKTLNILDKQIEGINA
ncbi:DUF1642 domain-containing protein [Cytobacillus horneckiae]|uniref:DUF1642 domain-containing protein n=1 Tax=Cytobacillus horneckiae TaxID=549687 RepID=UPI0034CEC2C8